MANLEETAHDVEKRLTKIVEKLEAKSREIVDHVKEDVLPQAEAKVRDNLWTSLFTALGLGLIVGLLIGLTSGRR